MAKILVLGIGNEYAHDDAVGLIVARGLQSLGRDDAAVLEQSGEGAALMETWKGADSVIVIDAVRSGAAPGTLHRFDAIDKPLPAEPFRGSTHAFGLYEAAEVARSLNQLPRGLIVYGVEGRDFTAGVGLSPDVQAAIPLIVMTVREQVRQLLTAVSSRGVDL